MKVNPKTFGLKGMRAGTYLEVGKPQAVLKNVTTDPHSGTDQWMSGETMPEHSATIQW